VEKELPFVTAVLIERMEDRQKDKDESGGQAQVEAETGATGSSEPERAEEVKVTAAGASPPVSRLKPKKPPRKLTYINATIFVERDNHRKIVIGRHGQVIKEIGIEARREIEEILEARVFLDLNVKVREKWRDSAEVLDLIEGQK
jgi:GTPase Era involved in 16S rRNA processing